MKHIFLIFVLVASATITAKAQSQEVLEPTVLELRINIDGTGYLIPFFVIDWEANNNQGTERAVRLDEFYINDLSGSDITSDLDSDTRSLLFASAQSLAKYRTFNISSYHSQWFEIQQRLEQEGRRYTATRNVRLGGAIATDAALACAAAGTVGAIACSPTGPGALACAGAACKAALLIESIDFAIPVLVDMLQRGNAQQVRDDLFSNAKDRIDSAFILETELYQKLQKATNLDQGLDLREAGISTLELHQAILIYEHALAVLLGISESFTAEEKEAYFTQLAAINAFELGINLAVDKVGLIKGFSIDSISATINLLLAEPQNATEQINSYAEILLDSLTELQLLYEVLDPFSVNNIAETKSYFLGQIPTTINRVSISNSPELWRNESTRSSIDIMRDNEFRSGLEVTLSIQNDTKQVIQVVQLSEDFVNEEYAGQWVLPNTRGWYTGTVEARDTQNNIVSRAVRYFFVAAKQTGRDLAVFSDFNRTRIDAGDRLRVPVEIRNQGDFPERPLVSLAIEGSNGILFQESASVGELASQSSYSNTDFFEWIVPSDIQDGNYTLSVSVENELGEESLLNNTLLRSLYVGKLNPKPAPNALIGQVFIVEEDDSVKESICSGFSNSQRRRYCREAGQGFGWIDYSVGGSRYRIGIVFDEDKGDRENDEFSFRVLKNNSEIDSSRLLEDEPNDRIHWVDNGTVGFTAVRNSSDEITLIVVEEFVGAGVVNRERTTIPNDYVSYQSDVNSLTIECNDKENQVHLATLRNGREWSADLFFRNTDVRAIDIRASDACSNEFVEIEMTSSNTGEYELLLEHRLSRDFSLPGYNPNASGYKEIEDTIVLLPTKLTVVDDVDLEIANRNMSEQLARVLTAHHGISNKTNVATGEASITLVNNGSKAPTGTALSLELTNQTGDTLVQLNDIDVSLGNIDLTEQLSHLPFGEYNIGVRVRALEERSFGDLQDTQTISIVETEQLSINVSSFVNRTYFQGQAITIGLQLSSDITECPVDAVVQAVEKDSDDFIIEQGFAAIDPSTCLFTYETDANINVSLIEFQAQTSNSYPVTVGVDISSARYQFSDYSVVGSFEIPSGQMGSYGIENEIDDGSAVVWQLFRNGRIIETRTSDTFEYEFVRQGDYILRTYKTFEGAIDTTLKVNNITILENVEARLTPPESIEVAALNANGTPKQDASIAQFLASAMAVNDDGQEIEDISNDAPDIFSLGDTLVTFTVDTLESGSLSASSTITVTDQTPPTIYLSQELVYLVNEDTAVSAADLQSLFSTVFAVDNVDGDISANAINLKESYAVGEHQITFSATDDAGNNTESIKTLTIELQVSEPRSITDITDRLSVNKGRGYFNRNARSISSAIDIVNGTNDIFEGELLLELINSNIPVKLTPDGILENGNPYWVLSSDGMANEQSISFRMDFEQRRGRLSYDIKVLLKTE
ncbi:hypothetical protein ACFO4O_01005 [Glaciecola siphonariae]|uniref:HYR domain-containing protein n=1 Tax=Glaciecola siphonariae TaxID=521012 RepID=A0ABV9LST6_9ALTE